MVSFEELMQQYVNFDYDVLCDLAKKALDHLTPICSEIDVDGHGAVIVSSIVLSAVMADGVVSEPERRLLKDVFALEGEDLSIFIQKYNASMVELVDCFCVKMEKKIAADAVMLAACLMAVDETISKEETALLRKFLGMTPKIVFE